MKKYKTIIISTLLAGMTGCAPHSTIGLVDVQRIVSNWPIYQSYQTQLLVEERGILARKESSAARRRDAFLLQRKYARITDQLSQQIRSAASQIATQRQLKLVVTRQGIGYGGVDITGDVEKALNITEKTTPAPS